MYMYSNIFTSMDLYNILCTCTCIVTYSLVWIYTIYYAHVLHSNIFTSMDLYNILCTCTSIVTYSLVWIYTIYYAHVHV